MSSRFPFCLCVCVCMCIFQFFLEIINVQNANKTRSIGDKVSKLELVGNDFRRASVYRYLAEQLVWQDNWSVNCDICGKVSSPNFCL